MISNGDVVDVDRAIVIGRAPEARRFNDTEQPRLVTVPSPHLEISSTHIEVRPGSGADHGTAVVTDLGSTNGTVLVQPGLGPEDLSPGVRRAADPRRADRPRRRRDHPGHQPLSRPMTDAAVEVSGTATEELTTEHLVAGPDRRFYAFVLDRLLAWGLYAGAAWAAYTLPDRARPAVGRRRRPSPAPCCWSGC